MLQKSVANLLSIKYFLIILSSFILLVTVYQTQKPKEFRLELAAIPGDCNNDGLVNILDFQLLSNSFGKSVGQTGYDSRCDFNGDSLINILDFQILSNNFGRTGTPTPTVSQSPSITPPPSPNTGNGIWTTKSELSSLPVAGQPGCDSFCSAAWNAIISKAYSSWGTPNLSDYSGLGHSQGIWAGALAYAKFSTMPGKEADAQRYYNKVVQGLNDVMGTEAAALPSSGGGKNDGSLAISRQFPRYVLAADLIGMTNWGPSYKGSANFVEYMLNTKFTFRVGDGGGTLAERSKCASNGCAMAQAARVTAASYLKNRAQLDDAWLVFRRYTGDTTSPIAIEFSGTGDNWYHNNNSKLAVNPKGATCSNGVYPADGVIPNDQGRGGVCPSGAETAPGYTQYPWEGLQGVFATSYILYRQGYNLNGKNPFQINDNALLRAVQYQWYLQNKFGGSWYDRGRAAWVKHLAWKFYGFKPVQYDASDGGRNMSHTQWINQ